MFFYNITDYGAVGDRISDNTEAFAAAIDACAADGGGTVYVPAGSFLTGPIRLRSNLTLLLDAGALVLFKDSFDSYPAVKTRWSGYECHGFQPLIFGSGLVNVTIKGEGTFDGQGKAWWAVAMQLKYGKSVSTERTKQLAVLNESLAATMKTNVLEWDSQFLRPPLLQLYDCEHVTIEGVTLQNSPFWNTHLVYCNHVSVRGVTIRNPADSPNGDGLDIDSCSNVRVVDCHFDVGDDCLCLKSGINEDGRKIGRPTENVTVTNCTMAAGHGGIVFGSENSGGIRNVTVSNCVFIGTDRGIRLKTNRARGGYIKNIIINTIYMENVFCPLSINSFYRYGIDEKDPAMTSKEAIPVTEKTPVIEEVHISGIVAKNCRAAAAFIYGLPEMPLKNISLRHTVIEMTTDPEEPGGEPDMVKEKILRAGDGMLCRYADGIEFHRVRVETRQGPALMLQDVTNAELDHISMSSVHPETPVVSVNNAKVVKVSGWQAQNAANAYLAADEDSAALLASQTVPFSFNQ
ncbi:Polygalacturonase [Evansella caseinilytica]|uniref:Polygalacturonase n=1 Tax=Evansella caseinilytica TaxID=1503961 RepID=A0A1H3NXY1_9BACI|nr:glycoside hydrolase family 28 protein [Evansella caseinilytica]SDY93747.1 Polygalacturonase [Evansella caseinilytica]